MNTEETKGTGAAVAAAPAPEVKTGPTAQQEAEALRIMEARPDVEFKMAYDEASGKLRLHGTGKAEDALPWPQISIGKKAGIVIDDLSSYPEDGTRTAYDAAIQGDTLLAKQTARRLKKAEELKAAAAKAAAGGTSAPATGTGSVPSDEQVEAGDQTESAENAA